MHMAAAFGQVEVIHHLIQEYNVDPNTPNNVSNYRIVKGHVYIYLIIITGRRLSHSHCSYQGKE